MNHEMFVFLTVLEAGAASVVLYKDTKPIRRLFLSPHSLSKAPTPDTMTVGMKLQQRNFGGRHPVHRVISKISFSSHQIFFFVFNPVSTVFFCLFVFSK
jgi:hypothetical protein